MGSNIIPSFFGIAVASLATGYYLGTLSNGDLLSRKKKENRKPTKDEILKKCKETAEATVNAESEDEEETDDEDYDEGELSDEEIESLS